MITYVLQCTSSLDPIMITVVVRLAWSDYDNRYVPFGKWSMFDMLTDVPLLFFRPTILAHRQVNIRRRIYIVFFLTNFALTAMIFILEQMS